MNGMIMHTVVHSTNPGAILASSSSPNLSYAPINFSKSLLNLPNLHCFQSTSSYWFPTFIPPIYFPQVNLSKYKLDCFSFLLEALIHWLHIHGYQVLNMVYLALGDQCCLPLRLSLIPLSSSHSHFLYSSQIGSHCVT